MCGICSFTGKHDERFTHSVLSAMTQAMVHRGPDGEGTYYGSDIALGFRRLAIIDLKKGSQPFYAEAIKFLESRLLCRIGWSFLASLTIIQIHC